MLLIELIKRIDKILFLLINHDSEHSTFDNFMLIVRNPVTWIPLYIFLALYLIKKTGAYAWKIILLCLVNVGITDMCSTLLKNTFQRLRPCYDTELRGMVRSLVDCGGAYSFPSSHAANHFGLAAFLFFTMWKMTGRKWQWLWIWASVICYAQVYVGKHFPCDVTAGALLGIIAGMLMAKFFGSFKDVKINAWDQLFVFKNRHFQKQA